MSELTAAAYTLAGGIVLYLIGQWLNILVILPFQNLRRNIAKADMLLTYYANVYTNPPRKDDDISKHREAANELRKISSQLAANARSVQSSLLRIFSLPSANNILQASQNLLYLSNSMFSGEPLENDKKSRETMALLYVDRRISPGLVFSQVASILFMLLGWALLKLSLILWALTLYGTGILIFLFGIVLSGDSKNIIYQLLSITLFILGIVWLATAPLFHNPTEGPYWVYVVVGMLSIILGGTGIYRTKAVLTNPKK